MTYAGSVPPAMAAKPPNVSAKGASHESHPIQHLRRPPVDLSELLARAGDLDGLDALELAALRRDLAFAARQLRDDAGDRVTPEALAAIEAAADAVHAVGTVLADRRVAEVDAEVETSDAVAEPVAASGQVPQRRAVVPVRHQPRGSTPEPRVPVLNRRGAQGATFTTEDEIAVAMIDAVGPGRGADGEMVTIGSLDRRGLYGTDRRIEASAGGDHIGQVLAVTAAGGIPGPPEAVYTQTIFGTARRPLRDGLPGALATRGAITYNIPATLDSILSNAGAGSAVEIVTAAQDLSGATKPVQTIPGPTPATVTVRAISQRLQHGNFGTRFEPEILASWLSLAATAHARLAEEKLLADIKTGSVLYTDTPAEYGAYRDLKSAVLGVVAELRDRMRDDTAPITLVLPSYVPAMLAVDLTRQQPGDNAWGVTVGQVRAAIAGWSENLQPVFALDSIRGRTLTTPTANGRTASFDADVEWAAFPTGAWVYLEGGLLDLGIVRDSVLNATNTLQTFFESWEAVAQMAPISAWCTSSLCASGTSQAPANVSICSPGGS